MGALLEAVMKLKAQWDKSAARKTENQAKKLKSSIKKMLGAIGVSLSVAGLVRFGKSITKMAIDAAETQKKIDWAFTEVDEKGNVVSTDLVEQINAWAEEAALATHSSKADMQEYLLQVSDVLQQYGLNEAAAATLGAQITEVGSIMAEEMGVSQAEGIDLVTRAVGGDEDALKKLKVQLTDNAKKEAMMKLGLEGTYDALDAGQQALVNYTAVCDQNTASLERAKDELEVDPWDALNNEWNTLKTTLGEYLLPFFQEGTQFLSDLLGEVNKGTEAVDGTNTAATTAKELFDSLRDILGDVWEKGSAVVEAVGGIGNALGLVIGGIAVVKGIGIVAKIAGIVSALGPLLGALGLSAGATAGVVGVGIIGAILLIKVVFEDLMDFMEGKDSVIGAVVGGISDAWNGLKEVVPAAIDTVKESWEGFQTKAGEVAEAAGQKWEEFKTGFGNVTSAIGEAFSSLGDLPGNALAWAQNFVGNLAQGISEHLGPLTDAVNGILGLFSGIVEAATGALETAKSAIDNIKGDYGENYEERKANGQNSVVAAVGAVGDTVAEGVTETKSNYEARRESGQGRIMSAFGAIGDALTGNAYDSGVDFDENLAQGIEDGTVRIDEATGQVTAGINSVLGFSVPEEGPLSDQDEWGGHFMDNLVDGMRSGMPALRRTIRDVAELFLEIAETMDRVSAMTIAGFGNISARAMSTVSNATIIQTNNFSNTFNGTDRQNQANAAKELTSNAQDVTGYMADGLAFGV